MEPFIEQIEKPKNQAIEDFLKTLDTMDIPVLGRNDGLGVVSFESSDSLFFGHFVAKGKNETTVSISQGLSYMKERDSYKMPPFITDIMNKMRDSNIE